MVKKVKRFVIFVLFSFFYSLFSGKTAEAAKLSIGIKNPDAASGSQGVQHPITGVPFTLS